MNIYIITNKINNKSYIGMTTQNIKTRFSQHVHSSKKPTKKTGLIAQAIKKYGKENFTIREIYKANNMEDLKKSEFSYINEYNTLAPNGYNLKKGGQIGGNGGANKGIKWSDSAKKEHSEKMKSRNFIPWNKGTKGLVKSNVGCFTAERTIGEKNPFYGKKHNEETRKKISECNIKRFAQKENREQLSISRGGRPFEVHKITKSTGYRRNLRILKTVYVGMWINIGDCAKELNLNRSCIVECLHKKLKTTGNYIIKYREAN